MEMSELTDEENKEIKKVFEYVLNVKKKDSNVSVVEAITNYCFDNDIEIEYIGSLIYNCEWFKNFVCDDCKFFDNENRLDDW